MNYNLNSLSLSLFPLIIKKFYKENGTYYDHTCSPTSHNILSTGAWKTWCIATVSSTAEKLALKDLCVFDIIYDNSKRISSANCFNSCTEQSVVSTEAMILSMQNKDCQILKN